MQNEAKSFVLRQLTCVAHTMHWCTVLLKHKTVNHNMFGSN